MYDVKEFMGEGCFGTVHKVRSRIRNRSKGGFFNRNQGNNAFACKTIPRAKVEDIRMLKEECSNLEDAKGHPHLLDFEETFEGDEAVHIISELLEGGELHGAIVELSKRQAYIPDDDAAWMVRNILDALSYCHDVIGIVHRDLKASNFMFKRKLDLSAKSRNIEDVKRRNSEKLREIKIIDFGLSTKIDPETNKVEGCLGTPYYVAPEVLSEEFYDSKCDVWSVGVITYLILSKQLPFLGKTEEATLDMVRNAEKHPPKFDSMRWITMDPLAVDFCRKLLQPDPSKRPTAREAMSHPWIVKHCGQPPPQRSRINQEHSIVVSPTKNDARTPLSEDSLTVASVASNETFDSLRSTTMEGNKTFLMESIPEQPCNDSTRSNKDVKSLLKRVFSPGKKNRSM